MPDQTFIEGFTAGSTTGGAVLVRLISVEHVATDGGVGDNFELTVTINDGGRNQKGKFGPQAVKITSGKKFSPNKIIFIGGYPSKSVGEITFKFEAETDSLSGEFIKGTTGSDALNPGTQNFSAPVTLEFGGKKSKLIFFGRVDLS
jgi:hypothetical protein